MLLLTTAIGLSNAQNVEIPDTAFLYGIIEEGVDINGDRLISYGEAEAVTNLAVFKKGISDMTGIEASVNLDTLDCNTIFYNFLTILYNFLTIPSLDRCNLKAVN